MKDAGQLEHVQHELDLLNSTWQACGVVDAEQLERIDALREQLMQINARLWDIEDRLREHEAKQVFGDVFIELARQVYITNDQRAAIKKSINQLLGSRLQEEKSYADYGQSA